MNQTDAQTQYSQDYDVFSALKIIIPLVASVMANPSGVNNPVSQEKPNPAVVVSQIQGLNPAAFIFTVSGTLSAGTYAAPTLEATSSSTLMEMKARVRTVSSSGSIVITVRKNNAPIGTITIAANSHTGISTPATILTFSKNDQVDVDITSAGTGSADLSVFVRVQ